MDTIANDAGCDSVITVNLTVRNKTTETITANVCDTYTSPSGRHTWFGTGIYKDTIPNAAGCDSILTINLTVIATPIVTVSTLAGSVHLAIQMVQGHRLSLTILWSSGRWRWKCVCSGSVKPPHSKNNYIRCGQHARW